MNILRKNNFKIINHGEVYKSYLNIRDHEFLAIAKKIETFDKKNLHNCRGSPNHQGSLKVALNYVRKLSKLVLMQLNFKLESLKSITQKDSFKPNYHKKILKMIRNYFQAKKDYAT